jgi:hypothetical protein
MPCCASGCVKASIENSSLGSWPGSSAKAGQEPSVELVEEPRRALRRMAPVMPQRP